MNVEDAHTLCVDLRGIGYPQRAVAVRRTTGVGEADSAMVSRNGGGVVRVHLLFQGMLLAGYG
jgi:hypothetical protein